MTLDQIDAELAAWKKSLGAAAQNLMDLYSLPTYQRLAGSNGVPKAALQGISAARVYPALDGLAKLFAMFDDLQRSIDQASELRQRMNPFFASESKVREIEDLLHGKSVKLPVEPVPFQQRTLAIAPDTVQAVTPAELMAAMERSFTTARDVVLSVDAAWQKLGMALGQTMTELAGLRTEAERWKVNLPALANAATAMEAIRTQVETDPLECAEEFDSSVEPVLRQARNALARVRTQHDQVERAFVNARKLMNQLIDLHQASIASWNDRRLKVTCLTEPIQPQDEQTIQALSDWLQRLEEKFRGGMLEPILVGLERWNKGANECVSYERAALNANQSPVNERNELRGRLEALKAKARAHGSAEHPDLTRISTEATQVLFNRPTPIDKASALVVDYERVLRKLTT